MNNDNYIITGTRFAKKERVCVRLKHIWIAIIISNETFMIDSGLQLLDLTIALFRCVICSDLRLVLCRIMPYTVNSSERARRADVY